MIKHHGWRYLNGALECLRWIHNGLETECLLKATQIEKKSKAKLEVKSAPDFTTYELTVKPLVNHVLVMIFIITICWVFNPGCTYWMIQPHSYVKSKSFQSRFQCAYFSAFEIWTKLIVRNMTKPHCLKESLDFFLLFDKNKI